ncbi:MAG: 50S ribosomal protein L9 [Proteobacteria bacterium]|nr:50S ribosomal protein L9 [Pseudomonadota bacterium]
MKVILKEDIFKLGSLGDEVEVKPGYARNYLIPQGKAMVLNRENVKLIKHQRNLLAQKRADAIEASKGLAQRLEEAEIVFTMKSGESGKLFGSVTQKHIYEALAGKGIDLDRKKLHITTPIKTLGNHILSVRLHTEVNANLQIKVVSEKVEEKNEGEEVEPSAEESQATDIPEEKSEEKADS